MIPTVTTLLASILLLVTLEKEMLSSCHGSVVDDCYTFPFFVKANQNNNCILKILNRMRSWDLEELDLKWQMAMLSIRVQKFEKKARRKIKFYGNDSWYESDQIQKEQATIRIRLDGFTIAKRPEDWLGKPLYSWFTKEGDMHGVPPPMTGNYMPTPIHVEIDESQFSYGQKQINISETSSENVETCESNGDESNESENNNFDSCESNFSVSTLESAYETVVESEPNVVMSKVCTDAPIIKEVDSDNEYVVILVKANAET
ncbi:hypothetical protein Tco_0173979 [Tanacetum coccineum]